MAKYSIKCYQKGYEIKQERINIVVAKTWAFPRVKSVDNLREEYSKDSFDPETILYCFDDHEEMVGFITSQIFIEENGIIKAHLTFPTVRPGYEETIDILFKRAIEVLKVKKVRFIHSSFGIWGGSEEWADKWGYNRIDEIGILYGYNTGSASFNEKIENVFPFDLESDLDDCAQIFVTEYGLPEEAVKNYTRFLYTSEYTLAYFMLREKNSIVATGAILRNQIVPTIGILSAVYDRGLNYLKILLTKLFNVAKEQGIKKIIMFFTHLHPDDPIIKKYIKLGFSLLGSNINYEKRIQ